MLVHVTEYDFRIGSIRYQISHLYMLYFDIFTPVLTVFKDINISN